MINPSIKSVGFFYRPGNPKIAAWEKKICAWLKQKYPQVKLTEKKPQALIVLGGDGTILEAARRYLSQNPLVVGLNLGHIGFLASVRKPKDFLSGLNLLIKGKYRITERMMLAAEVKRKNKIILKTYSLNDIAVQSLLGVAEMEVGIDHQPVQYIRGTGVLVATATGSTAYNLSAHGPIVMPDIKCFIVTELMDHNVPTPSIVVKRNREIYIKISDFRERGVLSITKTGEKVDVILSSDCESAFPIKIGDEITIRRSPRLVRFAEFEPHYFFRSLQEKFAFR
ncbi:MAG: NAD(+)/NADH kinase [Candidatus Harrisonbacteria bacterium]|nr:NAD(+)/NADH kinase [Candidatus Harrisonbacteria bacterium]